MTKFNKDEAAINDIGKGLKEQAHFGSFEFQREKSYEVFATSFKRSSSCIWRSPS